MHTFIQLLIGFLILGFVEQRVAQRTLYLRQKPLALVQFEVARHAFTS